MPPILESSELLSIKDFEWDLKFYFLQVKSNEVETTLKHPESFHGNVENLSKRKGNVTFTLRI